MKEVFDMNYLQEIAHRYRIGVATEDEEAYLNRWYSMDGVYERVVDTSLAPDSDTLRETMLDNIMFAINSHDCVKEPEVKLKPAGMFYRKPEFMVAAISVLLACLLVTVYDSAILGKLRTGSVLSLTRVGTRKDATLTLENGTVISLQKADKGLLAANNGIHVIRDKNGGLVYRISDRKTNSFAFNTISVPAGENVRLVLQDSTEVWLNSCSALTYPLNITKSGRKFDLKGEAFFSVKRDDTRPFVVRSGMQKVEVLGTRFNVRCYKEEAVMVTSVEEGTVRVNSGLGAKLVRKGQQSVTSADGGIDVREADIENAVLWKSGMVSFKDKPLVNIMQQVSRWYDVQVVYKGGGGRSEEGYSGKFMRGKDIGSLVKTLQALGINLELTKNGKEIVVTP